MAGQQIAAAITPLNNMGTPTPAPDGKIGLLSIGMCNAQLEFSGNGAPDAFMWRANHDPLMAKDANVVLVNAAAAGKTADIWANINNPVWNDAQSKVTQAHLSAAQIQVVWMEHAIAQPTGDFQTSEGALQVDITKIAKNVLTEFPNCKIIFVSTRTESYTTTLPHNPEPYAYETGFANKLTIQAQTDQTDLCFADPTHFYSCTPVVSPYLCWGPYSWIRDLTPRSDGKTWNCSDLKAGDWVHPTSCGVHKVADQLLAFFETSPIATPWYLNKNTSNITISSLNYTVCPGSPSYTVQFCADVSGGTGSLRYSWDFDDGDFDYDNPTPTKSFPAPGTYNVHLTVVDSGGNHAQGTIAVTPTP
jgi:PKD domain